METLTILIVSCIIEGGIIILLIYLIMKLVTYKRHNHNIIEYPSNNSIFTFITYNQDTIADSLSLNDI
jgi:hypothetical protein